MTVANEQSIFFSVPSSMAADRVAHDPQGQHSTGDEQSVTSFRVSLESDEIIERNLNTVRVLDGATLNLLASYVRRENMHVLEVYPPESLGDRDLFAVCYRLAWLALYGAHARAQEQDDKGGPPTIDVVVPLANPHLNIPRTRSAVYQLFGLVSFSSPLVFPRIPAQTKTSFGLVSHPLRPPSRPLSKSQPWLYSRWIPHLSMFFTLRTVTEEDLDLLHRWLNLKRVDEFWSEASDDIETHRAFITSRLDDPHTEPVIGSYVDGHGNVKPAVFLELYWAKEDRLGEFYEAEEYDQGVHLFVGSEEHRGSDYLRAWLPSVVHYLFLSDPRTQRIVAEPNVKNTNILGIFNHFAGMTKRKEFDFPHKRAALMMTTRSEFFEGPYL